ncbi:hypothetical protein [Glacieibacterium sp.]|uniref:hypothetical protein n=1 Tax=Glacieibacterium sp. TaxID=2860237 RepID=UPI003AFFF375
MSIMAPMLAGVWLSGQHDVAIGPLIGDKRPSSFSVQPPVVTPQAINELAPSAYFGVI